MSVCPLNRRTPFLFLYNFFLPTKPTRPTLSHPTSMIAENTVLPSDTIQGMLQAMSDLAAEYPCDLDQPLSFSPKAPVGSILGIELTPTNVLFFRTVVVSFFLQPVLLYSAWFMFPDLAKHRKRLGWTLTFFSAVVIIIIGICQLGYLRPTFYSFLGWDKLAGPEATLFSYWTPNLNEWILQFRRGSDDQNAVSAIEFVSTVMSLKTSDSWISFQDSIKLVQEKLIPLLMDAETWKGLLGIWMRWVISLPVFSLRPLQPTQLFSASRPYFLGGGGRFLLSMEEFPRDSWFNSVLCGYFVGYCLGDLVLGLLHYAKEVDPASGWMHHVLFSGLILHVGRKDQFCMILVAGAPLELSTIFLALGNMFPNLREDFWFPLTFFFARIVFVIGMLHEVSFNYDTPSGGVQVYILALAVHIFWFRKYLLGRRRRALRARKAKQEELERQKENQSKEQDQTIRERQDRGQSMASMSPSLLSEKCMTLENEIGDGYLTGLGSLTGSGEANTIQLRAKSACRPRA